MYWDALKHAMRMSLCDCSVLERVASEKRVNLIGGGGSIECDSGNETTW